MSTMPADLDKEIIKIGDKLHSAVDEIALDDGYFDDISDAIVAKDGGQAPTKSEMASRIEAIPKPVNEDDYLTFYDYNGTLLYSYTEEEAMQMTELPPVPVLEGYTIEWNYTLAEIQEMDEFVIVGAQYTPNDGSNAFTMEFSTPYAIDPVIKLTLKAGTYTIDWGDGSEIETITETSITEVTRDVTHHMLISTYPATCVIKIRKISGYLGFNYYKPYTAFITDIKLGDYDSIFSLGDNYANRLNSIALSTFLNDTKYCIKSVTTNYRFRGIVVPNSVTKLSNYSLNGRYGYVVSIPPSVQSMEENTFQSGTYHKLSLPDYLNFPISYQNMFSYAYYLKKIRLPKLTTNQILGGFSYLYSLENIVIPSNFINIKGFSHLNSMPILTIPKSISSIGANALDYSTYLIELDMTDYKENDTLPTLGGSLGTKLSSELRITVYSQTKKEELSAMTNWSQYADIIIVK